MSVLLPVIAGGTPAASLAGPDLLAFAEKAVNTDCKGLNPKSAPLTKLDAVKNACGELGRVHAWLCDELLRQGPRQFNPVNFYL